MCIKLGWIGVRAGIGVCFSVIVYGYYSILMDILLRTVIDKYFNYFLIFNITVICNLVYPHLTNNYITILTIDNRTKNIKFS